MPITEGCGLAARLARGVPEGPDPGAVDLKAAAVAVDADAPVVLDGLPMLDAGQGPGAVGSLGRLGSQPRWHAHQFSPGALPQAQATGESAYSSRTITTTLDSRLQNVARRVTERVAAPLPDLSDDVAQAQEPRG